MRNFGVFCLCLLSKTTFTFALLSTLTKKNNVSDWYASHSKVANLNFMWIHWYICTWCLQISWAEESGKSLVMCLKSDYCWNNHIITAHAIKPNVPKTHQEAALKLKHLCLTTNCLVPTVRVLKARRVVHTLNSSTAIASLYLFITTSKASFSASAWWHSNGFCSPVCSLKRGEGLQWQPSQKVNLTPRSWV